MRLLPVCVSFLQIIILFDLSLRMKLHRLRPDVQKNPCACMMIVLFTDDIARI